MSLNHAQRCGWVNELASGRGRLVSVRQVAAFNPSCRVRHASVSPSWGTRCKFKRTSCGLIWQRFQASALTCARWSQASWASVPLPAYPGRP